MSRMKDHQIDMEIECMREYLCLEQGKHTLASQAETGCGREVCRVCGAILYDGQKLGACLNMDALRRGDCKGCQMNEKGAE